MMDCIAVALPLSMRAVQRQLVIYTSSIVVFLALYEHRHLSLPWCVREVDEECNLMGELAKGFLGSCGSESQGELHSML